MFGGVCYLVPLVLLLVSPPLGAAVGPMVVMPSAAAEIGTVGWLWARGL